LRGGIVDDAIEAAGRFNMGGEVNGGLQFRQELWREFSDSQVVMLRALREELSTRRWSIMLDVDAAKVLVRAARARAGDNEVVEILDELAETLDRAHRELARIPEDMIPAF
jgi:hypothetical protein